MIQVCDAIMGTGKSQSAITWMNEHPNNKFIYITPYLDEAERIKNACPKLKFVEPSNKLSEYHFKKSKHSAALIKEGRNLATTHQSFKNYTRETLDDIRNQGYTLIIDENVNVLDTCDVHPGDLQMLIDTGYLTLENGRYVVTDQTYGEGRFQDVFHVLRSHDLMHLKDDGTYSLFWWVLPPELLTAFKHVFILTYLFEGQSLYHLLKMHNIPYEYIGVEKADDAETGFRFAKKGTYVPDYVPHIKDMIHILDNHNMNIFGKHRCALSMGWYAAHHNDEKMAQLKRNISNCFKNIWKDIPPERRMWATYNNELHRIKGKGYTKAFVTFSSRATNQYRHKTHLVYAVNLFMNVSDKLFYQKHGVEVDEELYALSIMIQWIWRSAIRDGKEIYIYIPSKRMRMILLDWMDTVSKRGNIIAGKTV